MAHDNLISHFDLRARQGLAEELLPPTTFLIQTYFNDVEEFASDNVDLDIVKGKRRTAAYVRRAEKGSLVDAIGFETRTIKPPYLKPKIIITGSDLQKRAPNGVIYDDSNTLNPAVQKYVAMQTNDLDSMITRNEELQAMQALFDAKVVARDIDGAVLREIDYDRDAALAFAASPLWTPSAGTILADCRKARRLISQKSGFRADTVLMGQEAADAFLANTDVQQALSKDWSGRGEIQFEMRDNGGIWMGAADGFDFWTYEEFIIDPADDVEKLLIPPKEVLVSQPRARATRVYGVTETVDNATGMLNLVATPRFIDMYGEKDPAGTAVQVHSAPLLVTNHVNAYAVITAVA